MLSSIFPISPRDKEAESPPSTARPSVFSKKTEQQSASLLSVLDDKNRLIAALRKQLQSQKTQLSYYIKRELNGHQIKQLSLSCTPLASEYSLPLTLAMNQFCKQAGIKTNLSRLHERLRRLDAQLTNALKDQEFVLRKIVNKLCEFLHFQEICHGNWADQFGGFINNPLQVDLFDSLLTATLGLRRRLEAFRICCDRLILVEEERTAIVDQVYSLPAEERTNRNFLLEIEMEKARLDKEPHAIEDLLQHLHSQLNCSFMDSKEGSVSKMLNKMTSDAKLLLEATKLQKEKLCRTKGPEPNRVLLFIKLAGKDSLKATDLESWGIKSNEELTFFELVQEEVLQVKAKEREEAGKARKEADFLKKKLQQLQLEKTRELEKLRVDHNNQVQTLKKERDLYKAQVEDLQAIRAAYAQLVDSSQPKQAKSHVSEWKTLLLQQMDQVDSLKTKLADQRDQIQVLSRFINLTRPNSPSPENSPGPSKLQKHKAKGSRAVSFPVNVKRFKLRKPMTTRKLGSRAGNSLQLVAKRNFAWQTKSDNIQSNLTLEKSSVFSVEFQVQNEDKKSMSKESLEELLAGRCSSDMD